MAAAERVSGEPASQGRRHAARLSSDSLHSTFDFQTGPPTARPSLSQPIEVTTLDPAHPRTLQSPVVTLSGKAYRQLLGLNPFKTSYLSLYGALDTRQEKLAACGAVLFAVAAGLPLPLIGVIFGRLISSFPPSEDELATRISQLLGVAAAYFAVTALYATLFGFTGEKIAIRIREQLFQCLLHLDQAYLDTHDIDVNGLLTEKVDAIHAGCSEKAGIFIQSICYFVAAFTVGFVLSPKLTGILLAAVIPSLAIVVKLTSIYGSKFSKRATEHNEAANGVVESALRAVKVVQAYGMMENICSRQSDLQGAKVAVAMRKAFVTALELGFIYFLAYSINGLAFYVGSRLAASGESGGDAGTVFAVVLLILDSSMVVAAFAPILEIFAQAASAREKIQDLLDAASSAKTRDPSVVDHVDLRGRDLQLQGVTFAYPARPTVNALNGLNLTCRAGTFTALVGTSGGGKSTVVSLLTGAYDYGGSIKLGDQDLSSLNRGDVNSQLAVVEQEHVLFAGSIFDNICHGVRNLALPQAELMQRCEQAVKNANVDFLEALPQGIHTRIGTGIQLSGGQQQRLCLARALIRDPAILVLDEPTSALDARSEVAVMAAVKQAAASGITVMMVAHRLSTVLDADHVAVFCEGKVIEEGPPKSLAASNGLFTSLLDAQNTTLSDHSDGQCKEDLFEKAEAVEQSSSSSEGERSAEHPKASPCDGSSLTMRNAMSRLGANIWPDWLIITAGLVGSVASGGLLLGEAVIFGNLVQLLNTGVSDPDFQSHANFFCLLFFVLGCVALVSWVGSGTAFGVASTRSVGRIQSNLLSVLIYLDMEWFAMPDHSTDMLMSAFTKDSGDLSCLSGPALGTIFTTSTSLIGGMILALVVAWKIAVVLLAAAPVMLAAGFMRIRVLGSADTRRREAYHKATSLAVEACRNRRTVAVYELEGHLLDQYREALHESFRKGRWFLISSNLLLALSLAISYFVYALAYWWGSKQVRNGEYSAKQFFIVLPALLFSAQASGQLFNLSPEIARAKAAARNVLKLLSYQPQILQPIGNSRTCSLAATPHEKHDPGCEGTTSKFAFEQVSLAYPSAGEKLVLQDVNLAVAAGSSVGLVGASGAGKSSAVALMERFYDPVAGRVMLDGTDVRQLDIRDLRDRIGLVSQDPDLLPGSISYNIRLGAREGQAVDGTDIREVCKRCGLHEFVSSLPEGYETDCGSNSSSKLSGGQRQRIALARALVRDPEILLLDEPTSALDAHSEQHVQESLAAAANGRTTVTVAHRLASVKRADKIYVFDQGRVVEEGTHVELVEHGGLYASMAKAQNLI